MCSILLRKMIVVFALSIVANSTIVLSNVFIANFLLSNPFSATLHILFKHNNNY